ncbi:MAG: diaminopimelate epimerase [Verrucomicrobiia bacterium]
MSLRFTKMNGAGNDFVMLDNRDLKLRPTTAQIARLCDRHRGVGADGLLLAEPCANGKSDFRMHYFNADGSEAEMCGNGARCFARFVQKLGWPKPTVTFETPAGVIHAEYHGELVQLGMSAPHGLRLHDKVKTTHGELAVSSINTGVPHAIVFVEKADQAMVGPLGRELRYHDHFKPRGTNVNFVQPLDAHTIRVRTYERGVEDETLACGTGVCASAIIAHLVHFTHSPVKVRVQGGDTLEVDFKVHGGDIRDVTLKGPADFAFEGVIELQP